MKLQKALRGYYSEQVAAVKLSGGYAQPASGGGGTGSWVFNLAFHAVLMVLIATGMIYGRYQSSLLGQRVLVITEQYNINERVTGFFDDLVREIQNNRSEEGTL
ncbi:MAG: hypothetical protein JXA07_05640 [Spirochaetes bacterium]|nr:hypothetical protein [Spirochaetota bacterium]